jgi:alpha-tubulin suppressor-like RCC1 family protein
VHAVKLVAAFVALAACGRFDFDDVCIVQMKGAGSTACVVRGDGALLCWGGNSVGEAGNGTLANVTMPTRALIDGVVAVGAGEFGTCAVREDGTAWCWGGNGYGQVGDGTMMQRSRPTQVATLASVVDIAIGQYHACARIADGAIECWGENTVGELGDGTVTPHLAPQRAYALPRAATSLTVGDYVTCATVDDGNVACWGGHQPAPFGGVTTPLPTVVPALAGARQVSAGCDVHSCALLDDGSVSCWGGNAHGELGDGTLAGHGTPAPVTGIAGARQISVGGPHTCARLPGGELWCWGSNVFGQLGTGGGDTPVPVQISGIPAIDDVAAGCDFTCARRGDDVWCWGAIVSSPTPVPITGVCTR